MPGPGLARKGSRDAATIGIIAGVSGAFARRFGVNPFVARIVTISAAIAFTPLIYVALWVLMPSE